MPFLYASLGVLFFESMHSLKLRAKLYVYISGRCDHLFILILKRFCETNKIRKPFYDCFRINKCVCVCVCVYVCTVKRMIG